MIETYQVLCSAVCMPKVMYRLACLVSLNSRANENNVPVLIFGGTDTTTHEGCSADRFSTIPSFLTGGSVV